MSLETYDQNRLPRMELTKLLKLYVHYDCTNCEYILNNGDLSKIEVKYINTKTDVPKFCKAVPMLINTQTKEFWIGKNEISKQIKIRSESMEF